MSAGIIPEQTTSGCCRPGICDADRNCYADSYSDADHHCDRDGYRNANLYSNCDCNCDCNCHAYRDGHSDADTYANGDCHRNIAALPDIDRDSNTITGDSYNIVTYHRPGS